MIYLVTSVALAHLLGEVRTLDALHLATLLFLKGEGSALQLATYDLRFAEAAAQLGIAEWQG